MKNLKVPPQKQLLNAETNNSFVLFYVFIIDYMDLCLIFRGVTYNFNKKILAFYLRRYF